MYKVVYRDKTGLRQPIFETWDRVCTIVSLLETLGIAYELLEKRGYLWVIIDE
jgi:hypothetical protein